MRRSVLLGMVMSLAAAYSVYAQCTVDCFCPEVVRWNEDGLNIPARCYYVDYLDQWGRCGNLRHTAASGADPDPDTNAWRQVGVAVEPGDHCSSSCTGQEKASELAGVAANVSGFTIPPTFGYQSWMANRECQPED